METKDCERAKCGRTVEEALVLHPFMVGLIGYLIKHSRERETLFSYGFCFVKLGLVH